ncbi:MAG: hypothetical protein HYW69_01680 [Candidatus Nealsonbacteria bacterium]|nr:hypothetical protein [Candidatus Nealsonbacteria bacterium]
MFKKAFIITSLMAASFFITYIALAQEEQGSDEVKIDTEISAEDLGVQKARILPDSPMYGFKNIFRGIREGITRNPIKKAEIQLRHSNEKVVEAKQLIEEKGTKKAQEQAVKVLKSANNDFEKIAKQGERFVGAEKFLNKIADQSLKQQVVIQRLQEQVPEEVFTKIEENRQQHLEKFGRVMNKAIKNPEQMQNFLPQVIENQKGSDFKELKAVEILRDLEDKVSPEQKEALRLAQQIMSQKFEQRFNGLPQGERQEKFQKYVEFMPGNPARQFEALETMKQNFQSPEIMQGMELAKDKAVQKFENRFSQFQGEEARREFMSSWRDGDPEDLRTMTEIEMRIGENQNFQNFQQEARNNFRDRFSENPEALRQNSVFQKMAENPDIVDLKMNEELKSFNFIREFKDQATQKFIENAKEGTGPVNPPIPGGLKILQEIKSQLPSQAQGGIDRAIQAQTQTVERYLERVDDPNVFQRYKQQIEGDQTIKNQIQRFAPRILQQQQPSSAGQPRMPAEPGQIKPMEGGERIQLFEGQQGTKQIQPEFQTQTQFQPPQPQFQPISEPQLAPEPQPQIQFQQPPATEPFTAPSEPIQTAPLPQIFPNFWQSFLGTVSNYFPAVR